MASDSSPETREVARRPQPHARYATANYGPEPRGTLEMLPFAPFIFLPRRTPMTDRPDDTTQIDAERTDRPVADTGRDVTPLDASDLADIAGAGLDHRFITLHTDQDAIGD
jgi:hypothetical protein